MIIELSEYNMVMNGTKHPPLWTELWLNYSKVCCFDWNHDEARHEVWYVLDLAAKEYVQVQLVFIRPTSAENGRLVYGVPMGG